MKQLRLRWSWPLDCPSELRFWGCRGCKLSSRSITLGIVEVLKDLAHGDYVEVAMRGRRLALPINDMRALLRTQSSECPAVYHELLPSHECCTLPIQQEGDCLGDVAGSADACQRRAIDEFALGVVLTR
jgi:hypothetical protein